MPTKKNISLRPDDIEVVKQLRKILENGDDDRRSLADVIRRCIQYSMNNKEHFKKFTIHS